MARRSITLSYNMMTVLSHDQCECVSGYVPGTCGVMGSGGYADCGITPLVTDYDYAV